MEPEPFFCRFWKGGCPHDDLICTVAYDDKYAIEAPMNVGGSLSTGLLHCSALSQTDLLEMAEKGSEDVIFVPIQSHGTDLEDPRRQLQRHHLGNNT